MIKRYVLGFCFLTNGRCFLIHKEKPDWQRGLVNGIGGNVGEGELPAEAMVREFSEETGIQTHQKHWVEMITVGTAEWKMDVFRGVLDCDMGDDFVFRTDEGTVTLHPNYQPPHNLEQTARWLYWLCLDSSYPDFFVTGGG